MDTKDNMTDVTEIAQDVPTTEAGNTQVTADNGDVVTLDS